jgi:catechol 2,3-dioxygenase-like lactoylglutathione lyase family enzyme
MLQSATVTAAVPVQDIARAREFYETKLGLSPTLNEGDILEYECGNGTWFFLFVSAGHSVGAFTQVAFEVDDIDAAVDRLKANGIVFEAYGEPGSVIVQTPIGRDAWFKDSEGNLLNVFQRSPSSGA